MKEIPILFSTDMVRAILDGRKTQTRRVLKMNKIVVDGKFGYTAFTPPRHISVRGTHADGNYGESFIRMLYGKPGDVLWVRETWRKYFNVNEDGITEWDNEIIDYAADGHEQLPMIDGDGFQMYNKDGREKVVPWKPNIFLKKEDARIWLRVKNVRVERLQVISEDDAKAEGILCYQDEFDGNRYRYKDYMADSSGYGHPEHDYPTVGIAKTSFCTLWESINGRESWDSNPWVWVIEFEVLSTTGRPDFF